MPKKHYPTLYMLSNGRAKINNSPGNFSISIPSKKNWFALLFGTVWLGGWYVALRSVGTIDSRPQHDSGSGAFLQFWTVAWTIGGIAIIFILLWGYFGKENLVDKNGLLLFEKTIFGIGLKRKLDMNEIRNFRAEKNTSTMFGNNGLAFWGLGPGKIKFDYGLKTFSFGLAVDDAEAEHIVSILNSHFPSTTGSQKHL